MPDTKSLVLKVTINGSRTLLAKSIEKLDKVWAPDYPLSQAKEVLASELEELKIKSRYTILPVFENEIINFENLQDTYEGQELESVNIMEMSGQNYGRLFRNDTLTLEYFWCFNRSVFERNRKRLKRVWAKARLF